MLAAREPYGCGHWSIDYPSVVTIIEKLLTRTPDLRPELIAYADSAKTEVL